MALRATRASSTDAQLARLVEERFGGLDDVVVSAVDYAGRDGHVNSVEQGVVQRTENRQSRRIYRQKHDPQTRG